MPKGPPGIAKILWLVSHTLWLLPSLGNNLAVFVCSDLLAVLWHCIRTSGFGLVITLYYTGVELCSRYSWLWPCWSVSLLSYCLQPVLTFCLFLDYTCHQPWLVPFPVLCLLFTTCADLCLSLDYGTYYCSPQLHLPPSAKRRGMRDCVTGQGGWNRFQGRNLGAS